MEGFDYVTNINGFTIIMQCDECGALVKGGSEFKHKEFHDHVKLLAIVVRDIKELLDEFAEEEEYY